MTQASSPMVTKKIGIYFFGSGTAPKFVVCGLGGADLLKKVSNASGIVATRHAITYQFAAFSLSTKDLRKKLSQ